MISLFLTAGLTVLAVAAESPSRSSWSCAYVQARLPLALGLLGEDTVSAEETRAARQRLSLPDGILSRASSLALSRSLGATRLVVLRCLPQGDVIILEAQSFEVDRPISGDVVRVTRPHLEISTAIDQIAERLTPRASAGGSSILRTPSQQALSKAGPSLASADMNERARGLALALREDPGAIDLRLSLVEALLSARDFQAAIDTVEAAPALGIPEMLTRALGFHKGGAQLEAGRYAEARETFETLRATRETAAVLNNLGVARFRLRDSEASRLFERASFLADPRQNDISFNRCFALIFEGNAAEALPFLDSMLVAAPSDVRTRLLRVWALAVLKREADRDSEWEHLKTLAPSYSSLGTPDLARRLERIFFSERNPEP